MLRRTRLSQLLKLKSEATPNPNSFTFRIPEGHYESFVPEGQSCEAYHRGLAEIHPFPHQLFEQYGPEVSAVFVAARYVTITKFPQVDWETIEWSVSSFIGHYLTFMVECVAPKAEYLLLEDDTMPLPGDSEVVQCIKELIKEQVRPMVQRDGGDVKLLNFNSKTGIVSVAMLGACRSCPSSQNTLKDGIERVMKHFLPEVTEVVEVKGHSVEQEYDLRFPDEKALRKQVGFEDAHRRRMLSQRRGPLMSSEELAEPDGDD
jgi:NFU1 iron-sulfur cluster scaffold homolog, mitochondrial